MSALGTTCHETPNLSLSQPHCWGRGVAALGHATCRGAAVPCTPASGRHRLLGRRWSAGSISRVTGKGDLRGHCGEHRAVLVYQIDSYRY